ncbi:MAG TPA: carbohydrate ABC transporter permease [Chloroflexota bacterium]
MALRFRLGTVATSLVAYILTIIIVFPIVWMVLTGFKDEVSAYQMPPSLIFTPILDNFHSAIDSGIMTYVYHSGIAVGVSTLAALALGIPAAFALVWHPRESNEGVLFWLISTKFMPAVGVLIPLYVIFQYVHLLDTLWALIIVYTAINLPLVVWIMYSFFSDIPKDLLEAGRVDGANDWQVLLRIILPISLSGVAVSALLSVIFSWNEFLFAVTFTYTSAPTVPVFVSSYQTAEGLFWARMSMALSLAIVVPVLLGWAAQRQLIRGLTLGAVKG